MVKKDKRDENLHLFLNSNSRNYTDLFDFLIYVQIIFKADLQWRDVDLFNLPCKKASILIIRSDWDILIVAIIERRLGHKFPNSFEELVRKIKMFLG